MLIDFYIYNLNEVVTWEPIWKTLRGKGIEANLVLEPPESNLAIGSMPDKANGYRDIKSENLAPLMTPELYEQAVSYLGVRGLPFLRRRREAADAVITTQGPGWFHSYRGLKLRTMYGVGAVQDSYGHGIVNKGLDAAFVHGRYSYQSLQRWLPAEDIIIGGYPKYSPYFHGQVDAAAWREHLGLDPQKKTVAYFSTWAHNSTLEGFSAAVSRLVGDFNVLYKPHYNNLHFEHERLAELRRYSGVHLIENEPSIVPFLAAADLVLADCRSGSFTEAMLLRRPVIGLSLNAQPADDKLLPGLDGVFPVCRRPEQLLTMVNDLLENPSYSGDQDELAHYFFADLGGHDDEVTAQGILEVVERKKGLRLPAATAEPPDISVIIPTYNRSDILQKCLEALARQTLPAGRFEVFVCDDGSMDQTRRVVEAFKAPYKLSYLRQQNSGPGAARNMGIRQARGCYVLFLNDDALMEPDVLELHLAAHRGYPQEKLSVLGKFSFPVEYTRTPFGYLLENSDLLFQYNVMKSGQVYSLQPGHRCDYNLFYTCNISLPRQTALDIGLFDEDFSGPAGEDIDLGYRLQKVGYRVYYEPKAVAWHDHQQTPEAFCNVYKTRGRGSVTFILKHPEFDWYKGLTAEKAEKWAAQQEEYKPVVAKTLQEIHELDQLGCDKTDEAEILELAARILPKASFLQQYFNSEGVLSSPQLPKLVQLEEGRLAGVHQPATPVEKETRLKGAGIVSGLTSIIVLNLNGAAHLKPCLESIRRYTHSPYELLVVDNGSTDDSLAYLRSLEGIRLIQNPANVGAPLGRNQALALASGEFIAFMDNDTVVTEGWLERFLAAAQAYPSVGVWGPRSNYVSGPQLVADAAYNTLHELQEFASRWTQQNSGRIDIVGRLILFCLFVRREVIDRIGGIDPAYGKWGWEDDDFGVRAQVAGFRLGIAHDVYIHHTGSQTSQSAKLDYNALMQENWQVFRRKWGVDWTPGQPMHYPIQQLVKQPFEREKHFVALPAAAEIEKLLYSSNGKSAAARRSVIAFYLRPAENEMERTALQEVEGLAGHAALYGPESWSTALASGADYLLLFAPDIIFTKGWLEELLGVAEKNPQLAAVGPMANAAPIPQRIKGDYQSLKKELHKFAARRARLHSGEWQEVPYLGGFCLLLRLSALAETGGLNPALLLPEALWAAYGRLSAGGYKLAAVRGVYLHHAQLTPDEGGDFDHRGESEASLKSLLEQAETAESAADWPSAVVVLEKALAMEDIMPAEKAAGLWNRKGAAHFRAGEWPQAGEAFSRGLELTPQNVTLLDNMAALLMGQKKPQAAIGYLHQALKISPDDLESLLSLGNCAIELGDLEMAALAFRRVQAVAPQTEGVADILSQLENLNATLPTRQPQEYAHES